MAIESGMSHSQMTMRERMAEWDALQHCWATNLTKCVIANGLKPDLTVPKKGELVKIRASDIYKRWEAFKKSPVYAAHRFPRCWLYGIVDPMADAFKAWLLAENPKSHYQYAQAAEELGWLGNVCRLVVMRRIMEDKDRERHQGAFQDASAGEIMAVVLKGREYVSHFIEGLERVRKEIAGDMERLVAGRGDTEEIKAYITAAMDAFADRERQATQDAYQHLTQAILAARVEALPSSPPELRVLSAPEETGE